MRHADIQKKTINSLLDKYEKSKTFLGQNQVSQKFSKRVIELFPKYHDDAEYDYFCDVNEALQELEGRDLVVLHMQRGNIIQSVSLNLSELECCYAFVNRKSRKEEQDWILEVMESEQFQNCMVLNRYLDAQKIKISKNQNVEYFDGNKQDYLDLLTLVNLIYANEEEQFIRDFSIKHFSDSKRVEVLAGKAQALLYQYGDYQEKDSVLEECGIVRTPTYVCMKGNGRITLGGQVIDLSKLSGDVALSTASLKELEKIEVLGERVVTVENLTSFHDYGKFSESDGARINAAGNDGIRTDVARIDEIGSDVAENDDFRIDDVENDGVRENSSREDFVVYLGGFHNTTKRKFLMHLYEQNPEKEYRHFGDIDAGGFYIYEHLKQKTGIPFRTLCMDTDTLKRYSHQTKPLTQTDRKRMESLLKKLDEKVEDGGAGEMMNEDYREVLLYMLENGCKLEQEAVSVGF